MRDATCHFAAQRPFSGVPLRSFFGETSSAEWRRPSVIVMMLANLVPVFGVLFWHWQVFPLMFLFWSENVIIGVINVLKMLTADPDAGVMWVAKLFMIPFFFFHYGMFTMVHGIFVVALFGGGMKAAAGFPNLETYWRLIRENDLGWAILGLALSRIVSFVTNYLWRGEYKRASLQLLMGQPYGRVVVMHVAILGGGFLMLALHSPTLGLLLLVALKIALDLRGHLSERRKLGAEPAIAAV